MKKFLFLVSLTLSLNSFATELAVFGDSITAGMLANKNATNVEFPNLYSDIILEDNPDNQQHSNIPFEDRNKSWATGTVRWGGVVSVMELLRLRLDFSLTSFRNLAVSGAQANNVPSQVSKWNPASEDNFAMIFIGSNDICKSKLSDITPVDVYEKQMRENIAMIKQKSSKVFIMGLPDLTQLVADADGNIPSTPKCETSWTRQFGKLCKVLTGSQGQANVKQVKEIILQYTDVLRRIAEEEKIGFTDEMLQEQFGIEDLSVDCFHPNTHGQTRLANVAFKGVSKYLFKFP